MSEDTEQAPTDRAKELAASIWNDVQWFAARLKESTTELTELRATVARLEAENGRLVALSSSPWSDKPLPEDAEIMAAHPMHSTAPGVHDRYAEAMRLVGAKHSKGALVELVNWLLARAALDPQP